MREEVFKTIENEKLIVKDDDVVLGLSGGPDSMVLLYILIAYQKKVDYKLHLAHVNHGVRGDEAKRDQDFVRGVAESLGLPFYTTNVDMVAKAKELKISSEEAGRLLRYNFFRSILKDKENGKIAVAHNKNDQAETLLMRFMRGTGIDGLAGMDFRYGDIIRPILGISREDIEKYARENEIPTVLDSTNEKTIYTRNKVRLELIPYIKENFNPNIVETLWRMSEISNIDSLFLEKYSENRYNEIVKKQNSDNIVLDRQFFIGEDLAIQSRIIRKCILELKGDLNGVSESHVRSSLDIFNGNITGKQVSLVGNLISKVSYDDLIIQIEKSIEEDYSYPYEVGEDLSLDQLGYGFKSRVMDLVDYEVLKKESGARYFDLEKLGKLSIRNRRDGDRFVPFGMTGSKKIKDYFIDEKIPRDMRGRIPFVLSDDEIIWIVGYRVSNEFKIDEKTKKVLEIKYEIK